MEQIIKPTVGRIVWFWPLGKAKDEQPRAAIVTYVWNDRMVNLCCHTPNGETYSATSVALQQPSDPELNSGISYCEWMPYQVGQARKEQPTSAEIMDHIK